MATTRKLPSTYTPDEVREMLKLQQNETVYKMIASGELPAFRVRRLWRIRREDVEALMAGTL
jgi:excisionase family DNA binding protein